MPDRNWLDEIYRTNRRPLLLTAWSVLRCQSLAEDAVHSAFARLAGLSHPPAEPKLYAFRAVRNAAIDLSRVRGRRQEQAITDDNQSARPAVPEIDDESTAAVRSALEQLDPRGREVVELHLQGRLTFQEIAVICDEPLPTVASRYRRSLEKLRQLLEVFHE